MLIKSALVPFKRQNSVTTMIAIWFFGQQPFIRGTWVAALSGRSILEQFVFAALGMNGRFSCCIATPSSQPLQHHPRCERTQRKIRWSPIGLFMPLAARNTKVRFGLKPTSNLQTLRYKPCSPKTLPTQCLQHSTSQHCVQHRDSALKIAINMAKSACLVCF